MNHLFEKIITVLNSLGFVGATVAQAVVDGIPVARVHIPVEGNGDWSDEYRTRLNDLGLAFHNSGLRWSADYPNDFRLFARDSKGQAWMCFNGGEGIDLIAIDDQSQEYLSFHKKVTLRVVAKNCKGEMVGDFSQPFTKEEHADNVPQRVMRVHLDSRGIQEKVLIRVEQPIPVDIENIITNYIAAQDNITIPIYATIANPLHSALCKYHEGIINGVKFYWFSYMGATKYALANPNWEA